ncbi:hypothetical protein AAG906_021108 [Vitis piasezkii]
MPSSGTFLFNIGIRGIHTFRDDEGLERGEEIQPSLLKAIEESKVSIVVFPKLCSFTMRKRTKVVPIFYHVDPSDVRRQTGSFGEPFARYGNVTEERVQRWRAALTQAGGLAGWHVMHGNIDKGISLIKKTLCSRKVLIILDDVSALSSRIIITTRNKHLLDVHKVDGLYEVQKLKYKEALQLFSLWAFKADLPHDTYWELSEHALNYCDGLPLAVKAVGSLLYGRTELGWENTLLKLQTVGKGMKVQEVFRLSYDRLDHTEKDLFLDIACFFRGKDSDSVGRILDSCNFSAIGMKVLKDCSFISILDNKIEMHGLMQQMGWEIIRRESPGQPGQRSRLWNPEDVHAVLTQKTCLENLKVMDLSHSPYLVECPDVSGAPSLETLNLNGCTSLHEVHPSIPRLKNLKILNLGNCRMLYYFPRIIGLEKLEVLNLSGCSRLEKFPDIEANMESLLELYLEGTAIIELPSSVGYLRGLVLLNMKSCKNLKILPGRICDLKSLKTLILSGCSKLERLPEITEVMEHLEELLLDGTSIRELPCSILHLKGLVLLNLRKCKDLRSLPNRICGLKSLETLIVSGCSKLNRLPEDLGMLQCLRRLQADGTAITKPPVTLVHLTNLRELSFSGCKRSTSNFWIPSLIFRLLHRENSDDIGLQLPSLSGLRFMENLDLSDCNLMEGTVDNKLCHLELLEVLNLSRNYMVSIPADISRLSNLKVLLLPPSIKLVDACDCTSLMSLPTPSRIISPQNWLVSTWLRPVEFMLWNCSGLYQDRVAMALEKLHRKLFPEIGYSIVIPGSRIPKWRWHENMGASVSATLPPHWLDNNFLGVALCAVFALEEGETIQQPGEIHCNFECREGPYFSHSITWTHSGDRVVETDHVCMMYQPRSQFVKSKSTYASVFKHIKASFSLSGASHVVRKCAIRLIYAQNSNHKNTTKNTTHLKHRYYLV